jgi:long-chain acyl-CoA synthetase
MVLETRSIRSFAVTNRMAIEPMRVGDTQLASSFESVPDMWRHRVRSTPDSDAFITRHGTYWRETTWQSANRRVEKIANGILSSGVHSEDRCVIFAETSLEWILADIGILCAGGATTTIFPSSTDEECAFIINDSEAKLIFCGTVEQAERVIALQSELPSLQTIVCFEGGDGPSKRWIGLDAFEELGLTHSEQNPEAFAEAQAGISRDQLATLMYTSGTTGEPKGVMLDHRAWVYIAESIDAMEIMSPIDTHYLFLPLSHVFAKVLQVILIRLGLPTVVDADTDRLIKNLAETRPTWMGAVPGVFEVIHQRIHDEMQAAGVAQRMTFEWALGVGLQVSRRRQQQLPVGRRLGLKWALADRLVLRRIRQLFGGRIRFFISGGAPLSTDIAEFFHACDLLILEGYGLTESAAASTFNLPENYRFGTVGLPIPGSEVKIAEDGEILLRSPALMSGYYKQPAETAAALTEDGWLKTGDIGILHPSGHLQITDRKKEIIVTSTGKNIAPSNFENRLKAKCRYVSHVVMHGDRRPYCVALIGIDDESISQWARNQELPFVDYEELCQKPEIHDLVDSHIRQVNGSLPSYEQVRRFVIMTEKPSIENGLLTPSQKVKRAAVEQQYHEQLSALYAATNEETPMLGIAKT